MKRPLAHPTFLLLPLFLMLPISGRLSARESDEASKRHFQQQVQPLIKEFCVRCHGPETSEADLRLDTLNPDLVNSASGEHWEEVLNQLNTGNMPPEDEAQPSDAQRNAIVDWATAEMRHAAEVRRSTGGRNVLRRLTGYEYANTMRDLLGLDLDYDQDLPPEGTAQEGFKNNSTVLMTSSLHMQYYRRIAKAALAKALVFGERPEPFRLRVTPTAADSNDKGKKNRKQKKREKQQPAETPSVENSVGQGLILTGSRRFTRSFNGIPTSGPILVRVKAQGRATVSGTLPRMHVMLGYDGGQKARPFKSVASVDVPPNGESQVFEFVVRGEKFPLRPPASSKQQFVEIENAFAAGTNPIGAQDVPQLLIQEVEIVAPYYPNWPPPSRTQILGTSVPESPGEDYVENVLRRFMSRAYRRPATPAEVDRMLSLYKILRARDASFESGLIDTLSAVLASPNFLLLAEPSPAKTYQAGARKLSDFELASRLSYFLWSSMPDEQLFALARTGRIAQPTVLRGQVRRMLADTKSRAFVEHFTSQWLDLDGLYRVAVNPEFFKFDDALKDTMREETIRFMQTVLEEDLSSLKLIDSDFAVLNAPLAEHYGITGVSGLAFRKVKLQPNQHRGGVLTHGSILLANSSGDDTHPVKRGIFVLERLLNDPPPPPPPAVPTLAEENKSGVRQSLKQKLIAHRTEAACISCHRRIDPFGVAFENYDGVGVWRDTTSAASPQPLQPADVAPRPVEESTEDSGSARKYAEWTKEPLAAPSMPTLETDSPKVKLLKQQANAALASLQRPYNHLRRLGPKGDKGQLTRFLGYLVQRRPAFEKAIESLTAETNLTQQQILESFAEADQRIIASNHLVEKLALELAPAGKAPKSRKPQNVMLKNNSEVDPRTTLPDDTQIQDLSDLKRYLLTTRREQFAETVVRKLLGYSLGRYLEFSDKETVDSLHKKFTDNDYRLNGLIEEIVLSDTFLTK